MGSASMNDEIFVSCGEISVTRKNGGGLGDTKMLQGDKAKVQVTLKEIFVGAGGNWRTTWKKVTDVVFRNENACVLFVITSDDLVIEGWRGQGDKEWYSFTRSLQDCWNKHQKKREKKELKRKQHNEDLVADAKRRRQRTGAVSHFSSPGRRGVGGRTTTYSKKSLRVQKFLRTNAKHNQWDSDDEESDEDGIFNRGARDKMKNQTNEIVDNDKENDELMQQDQESIAGGEEEPQEDEDEPTFHESDNDDSATPALDDDENESMEYQNASETPSSSKAKPRSKRRLIKKKRIVDESSDDDEELFGSSTVATATATHVRHKVVSPEGTDDKDCDLHEEPAHAIAEESNRKGMKDISNFFARKPVVAKNSTSKIDMGKRTTTFTVAPRVAATPPSSPSRNTNRDTTSLSPASKRPERTEVAPFTPIKLATPKKNLSVSSFFAPRSSKPSEQTNFESPSLLRSASTHVPTPVSPQSHVEDGDETTRNHTPSDNSPSPRKALIFSSTNAKTTLEEEDPIEDDDSPRRNGMTGPTLLQTPRVARQRQYGSKFLQRPKDWSKDRSSTASMALDLKPAGSPLYSTSSVKRSPPQPPLSSTKLPPAQPSKKFPWRGLRNLGNTCYMSASLQMMYSVPGFAESLERFRVSGRRLVSSICDMQQALKDFGTPGAASPRAIKSAMDSKTVKFQGFQQRDAHEFLGDLLDQIHEEIETTKDDTNESKVETGREDKEDSLDFKNPVEAEPIKSTEEVREVLPTDENFLLTLQVCLKCNSCGYER
jgi:hypothetical protein